MRVESGFSLLFSFPPSLPPSFVPDRHEVIVLGLELLRERDLLNFEGGVLKGEGAGGVFALGLEVEGDQLQRPHAALEARLVEELVHVLEERPVLPPVEPQTLHVPAKRGGKEGGREE